jgi:hypothetical protein
MMERNKSVHTSACKRTQADWKRDYDAFLAKWPHCCLQCHATGQILDLDAHEIDFCDECLAADKCPRCNADFHYRDGNSRCGMCGWECLEEMLPLQPVCDCEGDKNEA